MSKRFRQHMEEQYANWESKGNHLTVTEEWLRWAVNNTFPALPKTENLSQILKWKGAIFEPGCINVIREVLKSSAHTL